MPLPNPNEDNTADKAELWSRAEKAIKAHHALLENIVADYSGVMLGRNREVAGQIADMAKLCQLIKDDKDAVDQMIARVKRNPQGPKTDIYGYAAALLMPDNIEEDEKAPGLTAGQIRTHKTRIGNTMRFLIYEHGEQTRDEWVELIVSETIYTLSDNDKARRDAEQRREREAEVKKLENERAKLRRKGIGKVDTTLADQYAQAKLDYDALRDQLDPPDAPKRSTRKKQEPRLVEAQRRMDEAAAKLAEHEAERQKTSKAIAELDRRIKRLKGVNEPRRQDLRAGLPLARYQEAMSVIDDHEVVRFSTTYVEEDDAKVAAYTRRIPMLAVMIQHYPDERRIVWQIGDKPQQEEEKAARQTV